MVLRIGGQSWIKGWIKIVNSRDVLVLHAATAEGTSAKACESRQRNVPSTAHLLWADLRTPRQNDRLAVAAARRE